jgi:hypothetical protein
MRKYYNIEMSLLLYFLHRHEFLNQYLGGSTIFMKAKRSLTSSFDQLLKRRNSRDDLGPHQMVKEISLPMNAALCKVRDLGVAREEQIRCEH